MKNLKKNLMISVFLFVVVFSLIGINIANATIALGTAGSYGVLSSTFTRNIGLTTIVGDAGYTTLSGSGTSTVTGTATMPKPAQVGLDQGTLLSDLDLSPCTFSVIGAFHLGSDTTHGPIGVYTPGVYCSTGAMDIDGGATITLNGSGTYIFRSGGALDTTANSEVALAGGASACNVFWTPTGATTLGANAPFIGTVIDDAGITVGSTVSWLGRALSFAGTITTDTDTITVPTSCSGIIPSPPTLATLNVIKHVVIDNGGTATANAWTLAVNSSNGGSGTGSAVGSETGTIYTLETGKAYAVTESGGPVGYLESNSGDCVIASAVAGTTYTCTITDDDIAPQLTIAKTMINLDGGTKIPTDFSFFIDGVSAALGAHTVLAGTSHTVSETPDSGYTTTFSGDCATDGTITLGVGDIKTCTITNDDIAVHHSSSGSYVSSVPPLIDVVKVPSPLALPAGPGLVTYTYTLRNVGIVPVHTLTMLDDSCSPLTLISGDTNLNNKLDTTETWIYRCSKTLTKTETNVVTTIGWANGISATDIATATVVVGASVVPPLIHITKIPSPLALFAGAGTVTYKYTVTNPGTVPLSNVNIVDDKCTNLPGRVIGHPGDLNKNNLLESNESWSFTCKSKLTKTTTNTATASGSANGLTAKDFAIATVVVTDVPGLPKTGFPSSSNNLLIIISFLLVITSVSIFSLLKRKNKIQ